MKKNLWRVFSVGLIAVLFSEAASAQQNRQAISAASSLYVISAKAGGVNYVEGKVNVARKNGKSGYLLKTDELEIGDVVSTGTDGKAEILLNPGSFVRLGQNSTFEFATTSLEDLQLKLNSGSAIFEVITDNNFTFAVNTPKAKFYIVKSGVYRVDVLNEGVGKIEVWKGKAQLGDANATELKSGRQAIFNDNQATVAKFDRGDKDALETWSKIRAKELAKINAKLQDSAVRTSLMSSYYGTRWSMYESYGLWVYSRFHGSYCFLPFGYGWSSPYGYYYYRDIWYYNLPPVIYNSPPPTNTTPTLSSGSAISDKIRNRQTSREDEPVKIIPPFQRVQRDIGQYPVEQEINTPSFPTMIPSAAPPPPAAPAVIQTTTGPPKKGNN
jgi:hypothetical protein